MAFRGERRILACGRDNESLTYSKCAELFGNGLGLSIGGLALAPNHGYGMLSAHPICRHYWS